MSILQNVVKRKEYIWEIPLETRGDMRVPGRVFADEELLEAAERDHALEQVINVACLPGIREAAMAMPDIHWGYGFPIGGVAATAGEEAVISPGGVGYDISCGVRLLRTSLNQEEVRPLLQKLLDMLAALIPKGLGAKGRITLTRRETEEIMRKGVPELLARGIGWEEDLEFIEDDGAIPGADPAKVSERAFDRGKGQVGTLGSGNHFLEIQWVDQVYSRPEARALALEEGQVVVMIHSGSRGLGHQICTDYVKRMAVAGERYGFVLPDRQLACAPADSPEGADYLAAMACAANFAMANREALSEWVREGFERVFRCGARRLGMTLLYDVSHNLAKKERHTVKGKEEELVVHRKGATRAFPGSRPEVPDPYREVGQPVIVPGDMGSYSFVMVGREEALQLSFGSTCHGAGRTMSRTQAKKRIRGQDLKKRLEEEGILVDAATMAGLAEEAPEAYKDAEKIAIVCEGAGLSKRVARLRPMAVLKG